jgi:hypothetical protein
MVKPSMSLTDAVVALKQFLCGDSGVLVVCDDFDDQAGRSKHWVKVKNRRHPAGPGDGGVSVRQQGGR